MHSESFWKKNLFTLFISQFFYRAGNRSIIPFLPLYVKELSDGNVESAALWSGWIFSAPFLVSFFTTPFWGSIGDKFGRKIIVLLAITGFVLSYFFMSISSSLIFLLIAASTQEIFGGAYPAAISLTAANSPKENTIEALSYLQFANALGNILGPVIGGILSDILGYKHALQIIALIVAFTSLPIIFFVTENNIAKQTNYHTVLENFKYFFTKHSLIVCGIMLLGFTLSVTMIRPNFAFFIQQQFSDFKNIGTQTGLLLGLFGFGGTVSVALLPYFSKKIHRWNLLLSVFTISAFLFFLLTFINNIYIFGIVLFLVGFLLGIILPLVYSLMSDSTNHERKSGIMGIGSNFQMAGNLIGPLAAGYFVLMVGISFSFVLSGIILTCAIIIYKVLEKNVKKNN